MILEHTSHLSLPLPSAFSPLLGAVPGANLAREQGRRFTKTRRSSCQQLHFSETLPWLQMSGSQPGCYLEGNLLRKVENLLFVIQAESIHDYKLILFLKSAKQLKVYLEVLETWGDLGGAFSESIFPLCCERHLSFWGNVILCFGPFVLKTPGRLTSGALRKRAPGGLSAPLSWSE